MGVRPALPKGRTAAAVIAGATVSALVAGGGLAIAAIPSSATGDITSCISAKTGAVRIIDVQSGAHCSSSERTVSWSRGFRFRGAWSPTVSYAVKDLVTFQGSTYLARTAVTGGQPGLSSAWVTLAAHGANGLDGKAGAKGDVGPAGVQGVAGPKGDLGAQGIQGIQGLTGQVGPAGAAGATGAAGKDGATGAKGDRGSMILSGAGAPAAATGADGDYYLDTTAFTLYGPKAAGSWAHTGLVLQGPKGDTGATGAAGKDGLNGTNGTNGKDGKDGAQGPAGPAGATGPTGPQGPAGNTADLFTSSINLNGLSKTAAPAYDSVGQTAGCWGVATGRNTGCVNMYDSALMVGRNTQVQHLYVRNMDVDNLKAGDTLTVRVIVGPSPAKMGKNVAGEEDYRAYSLSCVLGDANDANPRDCTADVPPAAFVGLSGYFVAVEYSTTSATPLTGHLFTSFVIGNP